MRNIFKVEVLRGSGFVQCLFPTLLDFSVSFIATKICTKLTASCNTWILVDNAIGNFFSDQLSFILSKNVNFEHSFLLSNKLQPFRTYLS